MLPRSITKCRYAAMVDLGLYPVYKWITLEKFLPVTR